MGPGPYLYSFWGHSAIRVVDPLRGDLVYNFGSVDFSGDFFLRMLRGEVEAFVGVSTYEATARTYVEEDRTLTRRVLDLTPEQAESIASHLANYQRAGQRQRYVYHHFKDNCVTRVAAEIDRALDGALSHDARTRYTSVTFRDEALGAIRRNGLWAVAVDLAIAGATDRRMTVWESAFLPARFDALLDDAKIDGRPLVRETVDVYRSKHIDENARWTWPWIHVYLFVLAPLCLLIGWRPRIGAIVFGLLIGLLGIAVFLLWAPTDYDFTRHNWNVVVLPMTHLGVAIGARRKLWPRWSVRIQVYLLAHAIALVLLTWLHLMGFVAQSIGPSVALALPPALLLTGKIRRGHSVSP